MLTILRTQFIGKLSANVQTKIVAFPYLFLNVSRFYPAQNKELQVIAGFYLTLAEW